MSHPGPTEPRLAELLRLDEDARRQRDWKRFGPYLAERQWGTVREDYSPYGECWTYFPHDHARSRAYRWGEDGLLGITDRECRLCFSLGLWNGRDPILKERLFGLSGPVKPKSRSFRIASFPFQSARPKQRRPSRSVRPSSPSSPHR